MAHELQRALETAGYIFLEQFGGATTTGDAALRLGVPEKLGAGPAVHRLSPTAREEAPPNTYSGAYGLSCFPLHTDLAHWQVPPRYLALRCVRGFEEVPTLVLDGRRVVNQLGADRLGRALVQPRRVLLGRRSLLPLYDRSISLLRWDERYIVPAIPAAAEAMDAFRAILTGAVPVRVPLCRQGDTLVLDNWRVLHGRAAVPLEALHREIDRVYLRSLHQ